MLTLLTLLTLPQIYKTTLTLPLILNTTPIKITIHLITSLPLIIVIDTRGLILLLPLLPLYCSTLLHHHNITLLLSVLWGLIQLLLVLNHH